MTMLFALGQLYERLAQTQTVPRFGYSLEKIGFCIVLDTAGGAREVLDLHTREAKKKPRPRMLAVPTSETRTSGIAPNTLWDKTSYVLGITAGKDTRTQREHEAFKTRHQTLLADTDDPGLRALRAFLDQWTPDQFGLPLFPEEMRDANVVFRFDDDRCFLHDRPAAQALWETEHGADDALNGACLVSGRHTSLTRLHTPIKGVWGAQTSGAPLVSFNFDALESYGHKKGANAPVGVATAFAYTTALNHLLATDSRNRLQIGDASTVFWAEASDDDPDAAEETAQVAEDCMAVLFGDADPDADTKIAEGRLRTVLEGIAQGRPLADVDPRVDAARFYILGLSPNAARLSVRFWLENTFGAFARHIGAHTRDLRLEPPPRHPHPSPWRLLLETAVQHKRENIPKQLAGELTRAILTGQRYPATLLSTLLMRLRSDGRVNDLRVALLKAIVARTHRLDPHPVTEEPPVSLDPDNTDPGYLLGRLFALYESVQRAALPGVKATVKDKFYGAASSTPQSVFPLIDRGSAPHLAKLRKEKPGLAITLERDIAAVMARMAPGADPFPRALPPAQQALFALGYYHQSYRPRKNADGASSAEAEGENASTTRTAATDA
ncbi:type I-C CRISPR-associated protein Cas8c/Csd1 [Roseospira marina]|uniref:Type I-C CRISPR-associated protein Cas8c/Csd1 n=1 Tax=Roseospira marina TaxID=140057 RepID=A0A5M6IEY4_9PROT|nr:type I-C CRISPR-associated protein Cas8c/Csd1 [Roseospira marina]KAA5606846.1 type I-C CRISPR-associated protein Cas8c/Csd1 [Roseospira marina]MBB4312989.1 CRISPR-associated protein Csd1 [Roseospira marina]MBB5086237.1 CRISPR-associated protein Csd1 [Roseospira marina]